MIDYKNGKIYKLVSAHTPDIYVGSTAEKRLCYRFGNHRRHYRAWLNGKKDYMTSYEIMKYPDAQIVLIESYPCKNKDELRAREQAIMDQNPGCVNKQRATPTSPEVKRQKACAKAKAYYLRPDKKAQKGVYMQAYKLENKERTKEYNKWYKQLSRMTATVEKYERHSFDTTLIEFDINEPVNVPECPNRSSYM